MRVVLDTGVVLSAVLFSGGRVRWLRDAWTSGRVLPLVSRSTSQELIRALSYPKFRLDEKEIRAVLGGYLPYAQVVEIEPGAGENLPRCRDEDDQMFVTLAAAGRAELLVTGDRALLALDGKTPFRILAPGPVRELLAETSGPT